MPYQLVVLDFDGTFTDVEREGAPFAQAYRRELSGLLGRDLERLWADAEKLLQSPEVAWTVNGQAVAPANADPYVRSTVIAFQIFDRLDVARNLALRTELLETLYAHCYRHHTAQVFRPEAKAVLERLMELPVEVRVVTNSDPSAVSLKLDALQLKRKPAIVGKAKKYVVDEQQHGDARFDSLSVQSVPGLLRPVLTKRPFYFDILSSLWRETGAAPASTIVCGDIFELDLALPLALGANGHLVERGHTFDYERAAVKSFGGRAALTPSLTGFVERVERAA